MNTLLFAVGIFVFMITVYGTVVAGGVTLKRKQKADLPRDQNMVVETDGWETSTTTPTTTPRRVAEDPSPPKF